MNGDDQQVRQLLGAYALGQLSGEQHQLVSEQLQASAALRAELEEIAPVVALLGAVRDQVRPDEVAALNAADLEGPPLPAALLAEVRAAAEPDAPAAVVRALPSRRPWTGIAAAAAAVLIAGGGGFLFGTATPAVPTEQVALRVLDPAVQAQAALVAHTWGMEVKLVATGFVPGTAYRVTVTDDVGRTVGAGEFVGTGGEEMRCNLNSSVLRAAAANVEVTGPDGAVILDAAV